MKPYELIAALMRAQNLGALPLAKKMNRPELQPSIYRFVRGIIKSPEATTAGPLAKYFKLPLEAIYDEKVATKIGRELGLKVVEPPPVRKVRKQAAGVAPIDEGLDARYAEMSPTERAQVKRLFEQIDQKHSDGKQA